MDDIDQKRADIELTFPAAIPARMVPKEGDKINFEGTPVSYTPSPFVMVMEKGALLTKAAPAADEETTSSQEAAVAGHRRIRKGSPQGLPLIFGDFLRPWRVSFAFFAVKGFDLIRERGKILNRKGRKARKGREV